MIEIIEALTVREGYEPHEIKPFVVPPEQFAELSAQSPDKSKFKIPLAGCSARLIFLVLQDIICGKSKTLVIVQTPQGKGIGITLEEFEEVARLIKEAQNAGSGTAGPGTDGDHAGDGSGTPG